MRDTVNLGASLHFPTVQPLGKGQLHCISQDELGHAAVTNRPIISWFKTTKVHLSLIAPVQGRSAGAPLLAEVTQGPSWRSSPQFVTLLSQHMFPQSTKQGGEDSGESAPAVKYFGQAGSNTHI